MRKLTTLLIGIVLFLIIIVFYLWSKLIWISLLMLLIIDSFSTKIISNIIKKYFSVKFHTIVKYIYIIILPIFIIAFTRTLLFDYYYVPSSSMERTLFPGDYVIINKVKYGAKVPNHIENLSVFGKYLKTDTSKDEFYDLYRPLKGFSLYKLNNVVVFKSVENHNKFLVKRIIGMPSDTLKIVNSRILINNKLLDDKETYCYHYIDTTVTTNRIIKILSNKEYDLLEESYKRSLTKNIKKRDSNRLTLLFPNSYSQKWTRDNYGEIIIPSRGVNIPLNKNNIDLYKEIIRKYENKEIVINNDETISYTFKNNYYFVMGDNRHNSHDSRFFGFVPESYIQGKVIYIFSKSRIFD